MERINSSEKERIFKYIRINSTIMYVLAFLFVYFIYQFFTAFIAGQYYLRVVLFYHEVKFLTPDNSKFWYSDSALAVFSTGPIISMVFAFIFMMLFRKYSNTDSVIKVFLLWGVLHFVNRIIGSFAIGTIFLLYGSNLIADWLYLGMEFKILLVAMAIILLIVIGNFSVYPILNSSNSFSLINKRNRAEFIKNQIFIPWFFGSLILFVLFLPRFPLHELLINLSMLIMLIPVYFQFERVMIPNIEEEDYPENKTSWLLILLFSLLIIGYRIIFGKGIPFGTESENSLGVSIVIVLASLMIIGIIIIGIRSVRQKRKKVYEMILKSLPNDADMVE
ncbi:MAG: hypothetical protein NTZ33_16090 [Bacteroidetes bacterium]|nr:hypothetical protein [Bacteroidota bacterium]